MAQILRQSTAVDVLIGPFVDLTDAATAETGESPSVKLSKNGQTLAAKNDVTTPVHDADGYYNCELDTTDSNTVGTLVLTVAASANALPVRHEYQVVEEAVYDASYTASAAGPLQSTVAGRTLDVSAGGEAGIDWANVGSPTTSVTLSGTTVGTTTTNTDMRGTDSAALASVCTEARLSELDAATAGKMANQVDEIRTDTGEIGTAGAGLTNINLPNQTMDITGNLSGSVGSVTAGVTLADGAHGGSSAVLTLDHVIVSSTTDHAIDLQTSGSGKSGINIGANSATGAGIVAFGELHGMVCSGGTGTAGNGFRVIANNTGAGFFIGSTSGEGLEISASGDAIDSTTVALLYPADVTAISGSTVAADNLEESTEAIITGTAQTGTLSTTVMTTDLTGYADNELIGRVVVWKSGTADGQASDITDYASASGTVTYTAITTAPANGDLFVIV